MSQIRTVIECSRCGLEQVKVHESNEAPGRWCNATCRKREAGSRKRRRDAGMDPAGIEAHIVARREELKRRRRCPRPDKVGLSEASARHAVASMLTTAANPDGLNAYQCRCGSWHVGNSPKASA